MWNKIVLPHGKDFVRYFLYEEILNVSGEKIQQNIIYQHAFLDRILNIMTVFLLIITEKILWKQKIFSRRIGAFKLDVWTNLNI